MDLALDARSTALLRTLLDDAPALMPFAEAVVLHLMFSASGEEGESSEAVLRQVVEVLRFASDPDAAQPAVLLARNPRLLASFFQNSDLLNATGPESRAVARWVVAALERLDPGMSW